MKESLFNNFMVSHYESIILSIFISINLFDFYLCRKNIDSRQVMIVIRQERFGIRFAWIDFLMLWLEQGKRQNKLLYQRMLLIIKATDQEE